MSSFWDALTGRKSTTSSSSISAPTARPSTSADPAPPPDAGDTAPTSSFTSHAHQPTFDYAAAGDVSSFLKPATNDPSTLHPLAGLGGDLTYLDLDDAALSSLPGARTALPSRGWSDDLCYGTGATYLIALSLGGAWGLVEGLNKTPANSPPRLKLNGVLNAITRRGPFMGNSAGVLAMVYNGINSTVGYYRGKHDTANSVISGLIAGAIFKSTRGVRPMAVSAGIVSAAAATWSVGSKALL
ncbi:Tim17/Tim22/Tim23/Pmp24 family-domain-containing protein [Tricharina praecox]|uniref:Tim17/Tim22/Tim23/Pmp24 family-domain-containing protein n=1 Tax=Tricharina praecox TaxID=43433 RepID=UPI00221EA141|nr:Tim17/Tim22/Tim23/Pmp24 family-domain-containing protein [Tricharina praecox]KAI5850007.1 Tim17/Tim22/Tim23/Pmp24 family-domain-containing protein [Tricharina praecox]